MQPSTFIDQPVAQADRASPRHPMRLIDAAPKYDEGRGFRVPVRVRKDLAGLRELIGLKLRC